MSFSEKAARGSIADERRCARAAASSVSPQRFWREHRDLFNARAGIGVYSDKWPAGRAIREHGFDARKVLLVESKDRLEGWHCDAENGLCKKAGSVARPGEGDLLLACIQCQSPLLLRNGCGDAPWKAVEAHFYTNDVNIPPGTRGAGYARDPGLQCTPDCEVLRAKYVRATKTAAARRSQTQGRRQVRFKTASPGALQVYFTVVCTVLPWAVFSHNGSTLSGIGSGHLLDDRTTFTCTSAIWR